MQARLTELDNTCRYIQPLRQDPEDMKRDSVYQKSNPTAVTVQIVYPPKTVLKLLPAYLKKMSALRNRTVTVSRCNNTDEIYTRAGDKPILISKVNLDTYDAIVTDVVLLMPNFCGDIDCIFQSLHVTMDSIKAWPAVLKEHEELTGETFPSPFAHLFTTAAPPPKDDFVLPTMAVVVALLIIIIMLISFVIYSVVYKSKPVPSQQPQVAEVPLVKMESVPKKEEDGKAIEQKAELLLKAPKCVEDPTHEDAPCTSQSVKPDELLSVD